MQSFGRTEKLMLYTAVLALMAFSYFLYDDSLLFPKQQNDKLKLIGTVSYSQNDVRRKNIDTFSWVPAGQKDQVFQNDSIYTGERSEAKIELSSGTQIAVQPNSLVTLNIDNGQMNLDLRYGNFVGEIAQGSTLKVKSGNDEFELQGEKNSRIELKKAHSGVVDLKLMSGDVKYLNRKSNKASALSSGAAVSVSARGGLQEKKKPEVHLVTPDKTTWVRINPDDPLPFAWKGESSVKNYEFELATNGEFQEVVVTRKTPDSQLPVTDPLAAGIYHWRVKALDESGNVVAVSPSQRVAVTPLRAPQITSPTPQAQLQFSATAKEQKNATQITWKASGLLKKFNWQISSTPDFSQVIAEAQTPELEAIPPLAQGQYWVRVQGHTEKDQASPWSEAVSFSVTSTTPKPVVKAAPVRPARPILITKDIAFKPNDAERGPAATERPTLAWKPVAQSQGYQVEVSKDLNFKNPVRWTPSTTETQWEQYRPGKHYYRVFAKGPNGTLSEPSETGSITIDYLTLSLQPLQGLKASKSVHQEVPVTWSVVPGAKSYVVQLATSQDFAQPRMTSFETTSGSLSLPEPGKYFVRVQAFDENSEPLTLFSNTESIAYTHISTLKSPQLMEPFNNASIYLQTADEPNLWLEWRRVPDANSYTLEISDKPDFSRVLVKKKLDVNRFLIKDRIPMGKIYWRVRAEITQPAGGSETSEWTEKREFVIHHGKNGNLIK